MVVPRSARSRRSCGCRSSATRKSSTSRWSACRGMAAPPTGRARGTARARSATCPTLMRRVHHVSLVAPYELCRVGDHGDAPVNPIDLADAMKRIEAFYTRLHDAGAAPLSAGGDHLVTLPILRAIARERPVGSFISTPIPTPATAISAARNTPMGRPSAAPSRRPHRSQTDDPDRRARLDL